MENKILHLTEIIYEKKDQIDYNNDKIKKGHQVIFYSRWNNDLEIEIEAFEIAIENHKQNNLKTA